MPAVFQHPRFLFLLVLLLLATFALFFHDSPTWLQLQNKIGPAGISLSDQVTKAEERYKAMLLQREGLIEKFGPEPKDVHMFPPDTPPWPSYTVWDFFPASFNCPHEVERIGRMGDGGKWFCGLHRIQSKKDCIVYSFGINYESSFEAELLSSTDSCQVWGYDFSVNAFGPEIEENMKNRTHFYPFALGGSRGKGPENSEMYTLADLMHMNGHTHIDVVKMDIEGYEFETLENVLKPYLESNEPLPFAQLQLEIHVWKPTFPDFLGWWQNLERVGLRPFWTEPNLVYQNYHHDRPPHLAEYSFLNIHGSNVFITE